MVLSDHELKEARLLEQLQQSWGSNERARQSRQQLDDVDDDIEQEEGPFDHGEEIPPVVVKKKTTKGRRKKKQKKSGKKRGKEKRQRERVRESMRE